VGNLSAHVLQFARFKRKRLGASKYSNLIFERFICVFSLVFSANQKIVNLLHCWEGATSFPGLSYEDEARDEKALVWAGQFCILIG
jgi:hypothetical protein